jgi:hypothetical protein
MVERRRVSTVRPSGALGAGPLGAFAGALRAGSDQGVKRRRGLRRLLPDPALFRRRAAGATLRQLAADYGVSHTTLGRFFARPEARSQLREASRLLRAERKADAAAARNQRRLEQQLRRTAGGQARAERAQARHHRAVAAGIAARRRSRPSAQSGHADLLDEHDLRQPLSRADLYSRNDSTAAAIVAAGGGIEALLEATGLRSRENLFGLIVRERGRAAERRGDRALGRHRAQDAAARGVGQHREDVPVRRARDPPNGSWLGSWRLQRISILTPTSPTPSSLRSSSMMRRWLRPWPKHAGTTRTRTSSVTACHKPRRPAAGSAASALTDAGCTRHAQHDRTQEGVVICISCHARPRANSKLIPNRADRSSCERSLTVAAAEPQQPRRERPRRPRASGLRSMRSKTRSRDRVSWSMMSSC